MGRYERVPHPLPIVLAAAPADMLGIAPASRYRIVALASGICAAAIVATACMRSFDVWVIPTSTVSELGLGIADRRSNGHPMQVEAIRVYDCDSICERPNGNYYPAEAAATWVSTVPPAASPQPATRITYGRDEQGRQTRHGPTALEVGKCYIVRLYAKDARGAGRPGHLGFDVSPEGNIIQMSERDYSALFKKGPCAGKAE